MSSRVTTWLLVLFLLAAGLRVGWVLVRWGPPGRAERLDYPDEEAYVLSARSLAAGQGLVDEFGYRATYMPGYPAFLATFQGLPRPLLWARIAQAVLAAWIAPATFLLARRFIAAQMGGSESAGRVAHLFRAGFAISIGQSYPSTNTADRDHDSRNREPKFEEPGPPCAIVPPVPSPAVYPDNSAGEATGGTQGNGRVALLVPFLAGLAVAFDPFLIFFSGLLLTEALFAAVVVTAWMFLQKRGRSLFLETFCAAVLLWVAVMLRPAAAILVVLVPVALLVRGRLSRDSVVQAVLIPALLAIGLLPWAARNRAVIGRWEWLSTRGGISLYDGLQPGATGGSDLAHTKRTAEVQGLGEVQWDERFRSAAWAEARRDPARVVRLAGRKFLRTWSPTPNVEEYHSGLVAWVSAVWMLPALAFAAIGWWRHRRELAAWAMLLLPVLAFTLIHMIYVGSVRYRVPLMPFVLVLSAAGLGSILKPLLSAKKTGA